MDLTTRITSHFTDYAATIHNSAAALAEPTAAAVELLFATLANNGKILACGNGG